MARYLLRFAPIITPCCGLLGAIGGAISNYNAMAGGTLVIGFVIASAMILGVPAGFLFWAMSINGKRAKGLWAGIMIAYCLVLFTLFYLPIYGLVSV